MQEEERRTNTLPKIPSLKQTSAPKYDSPFAIPDDAEVRVWRVRSSA
jgi:hypothetical protein